MIIDKITNLMGELSVYHKAHGRLSNSELQEAHLKYALSWLDDVQGVFDILSTNASSQVGIWVIKESKISLDLGRAFLSVTKALYLIEHAYWLEDLPDTYLLLRKVFESTLQYLFFYMIREKAQSAGIDTNEENIGKLFDYYDFDNSYNNDTSRMHYWATNTPLDEQQKRQRRQSISISNYMKALKEEYPLLKECISLFLPSTEEQLLERMNDYVHGNSIDVHFSQTNIKERIEEDTVLTTILIVTYITLIKPTLLRSDDYTSCMEANLIPEEESAYWIAPIFSDFFSSYVDPKFPGLRGFLHEHNEAGMEIAEI